MCEHWACSWKQPALVIQRQVPPSLGTKQIPHRKVKLLLSLYWFWWQTACVVRQRASIADGKHLLNNRLPLVFMGNIPVGRPSYTSRIILTRRNLLLSGSAFSSISPAGFIFLPLLHLCLYWFMYYLFMSVLPTNLCSDYCNSSHLLFVYLPASHFSPRHLHINVPMSIFKYNLNQIQFPQNPSNTLTCVYRHTRYNGSLRLRWEPNLV